MNQEMSFKFFLASYTNDARSTEFLIFFKDFSHYSSLLGIVIALTYRNINFTDKIILGFYK